MDICFLNVTVIFKPLFSGLVFLSTARVVCFLRNGNWGQRGEPTGVCEGRVWHSCGGVETSPVGCCWGRGCPFHGTAHLPQSSTAPVQSDTGDKPADGYRQADRETDCPQPPKARSPVPAHVVLRCLWAVCRDGKEREKDKSLFPHGEIKYGEYSHQTQTEMGKDSAWQMKCHQCFRWTHSSAEACFCQLVVHQTLGESKGNWKTNMKTREFEVLATCRHLTTGPTIPLASLGLELWHLSFCNFKTCSQLTGTVLDNITFLPSRATMENHGYPDLLHYPSATLERDCCSQHVLDGDERSTMNWKSSQLHGCNRRQCAIN